MMSIPRGKSKRVIFRIFAMRDPATVGPQLQPGAFVRGTQFKHGHRRSDITVLSYPLVVKPRECTTAPERTNGCRAGKGEWIPNLEQGTPLDFYMLLKWRDVQLSFREVSLRFGCCGYFATDEDFFFFIFLLPDALFWTPWICLF